MLWQATKWVAGVCALIAVVAWLGKGSHGADLGTTVGDAIHGGYEGIRAAINHALG